MVYHLYQKIVLMCTYKFTSAPTIFIRAQVLFKGEPRIIDAPLSQRKGGPTF